MKAKQTTALCIRTSMCGGGTSYDVYWPIASKPSRPLHNGHIYATIIGHGKGEYYRTTDAIDPRSRIEAKAKRLEARIAKRAFPELGKLRVLPSLWAPWDLPSAEIKAKVRLELPE